MLCTSLPTTFWQTEYVRQTAGKTSLLKLLLACSPDALLNDWFCFGCSGSCSICCRVCTDEGFYQLQLSPLLVDFGITICLNTVIKVCSEMARSPRTPPTVNGGKKRAMRQQRKEGP